MIREYCKFLKDYFKLTKMKRKYLVITIITAIFYKSLNLLLPYFSSLIVKYVTNADIYMSYISLFLFFITYILYNISLFANYKIYGYNMRYCYTTIQSKILNKLLNVDNNFSRLFSKERIMNSINSDVVDIGDMADQISELFTTIIQVLAVLVIVFIYSPYFAAIMLLYSIIYISVRNRADRKVAHYQRKVVSCDDKYSSLLGQIISGLQEIKTFNIFEKLKNKLNYIQKTFSKNYIKKRKYCTIMYSDVKFITYFFRIVLYIILLLSMIKGNTTIDVLVLIIAYHENLVSYLDDLISSTTTIRDVNIAVCRVNQILNYKYNTNIEYGDNNTDDIEGIVEFKNVSFKYKDKAILKNINLKVNKNTVVAIVGEAGSGKTVLCNLLLRINKVTEGNIYIDDVNIYDYTKEIYSSNVSVVNQKPFIFNMSIRENLNFVDTNVEHQVEACKKVGMHDFIMSLPEQYDTVLRENANNISGGQKQLISIARTLLSTSEILIFDDITTSLDPDTAKLVPSILKELKKNHTIILVTKKPELMKCADEIVVLNKGKIVGKGKHKDLMQNNEIYQMLQSRKSPSRIGVFDNV